VLEQEPLPLAARDQEERVVLHLAAQPRIDLLALEVGVRLDHGPPGDLVAEADRPLHQALVGEDPVEAVERALVLARVVLQRALDGGDERALGRSVGPVQQDQLVDPARANEGAEDPVDGVLHLLVAHHRRPALAFLQGGRLIERTIEELEAPHRPRRLGHHLGAVEVEAVADVLGGVARVHARHLEERLHVLLEGEDGLVAEERTLDLLPDALQVAE